VFAKYIFAKRHSQKITEFITSVPRGKTRWSTVFRLCTSNFKLKFQDNITDATDSEHSRQCIDVDPNMKTFIQDLCKLKEMPGIHTKIIDLATLLDPIPRKPWNGLQDKSILVPVYP